MHSYHIPCGFSIVGSKIRDIGGEAFVEPQVIPPPGGHQVSKPLRWQSYILLTGFHSYYQMFGRFVGWLFHWVSVSVIPYGRAHGRLLLPPTPCLHWTTQQDYIRVRSLCKWSSPSSPWLQHWSQEEQSDLKWVQNRDHHLIIQIIYIKLIHCSWVAQCGCTSYLTCSGGRKSCSSPQRMPVLVQSSPGHSFPGPPLWPSCEPRSWSEQTQHLINRSGGKRHLGLESSRGQQILAIKAWDGAGGGGSSRLLEPWVNLQQRW